MKKDYMVAVARKGYVVTGRVSFEFFSDTECKGSI